MLLAITRCLRLSDGGAVRTIRLESQAADSGSLKFFCTANGALRNGTKGKINDRLAPKSFTPLFV